MLIAICVVDDGLPLDGFLGHREVNVNPRVTVRGQDGEFEGDEGLPGVAVGFIREVTQGVLVGVDVPISEASIFVCQRPLKQAEKVVGAERLELKDLGARDEGRIDVKIGIVGCRANETDRAVLDVRQEDILLGFVEAVNFVDEEDRGLIAKLGVGAGLLNLGPDFSHVRLHAVEGFEA